MRRVEEDIKELLCYIMACTEIAVARSDIVELSDLLHLLLTHTTMCHVQVALDEISKEQYKGMLLKITYLYLHFSLIISTPNSSLLSPLLQPLSVVFSTFFFTYCHTFL